jgi:hypothetical protein
MKIIYCAAFTFLNLISLSAYAQYQLIEKDGDKSALYFNTKLDNVDGVIYTSMFENFASPRKIKSTDIPYGIQGEFFSSEAVTFRIRCSDKTVSMVDGQKFLKQNMQGGIVSYDKVLAENEVKWTPLDKKSFNHEPYKSMLNECSKPK